MRLWELEQGDDGNIGHGFGGGVRGVHYDSDDEDDEDDELPPPPPAPVAAQVLVPAPIMRAFGPAPPRPQAPAQRPARERDPGLQRFLRMARDDEEDE